MGPVKFVKIFGIMLAMTVALATCVQALPKVEEVVSGNVNIECEDSTMIINASDPKSIINFSSFDIMENESVRVTLPTSDSEILNRVTGGNPSELLGYLSCNGLFILVNESGIHVGPNANIDVRNLILSTRDITDSNFISGEYLFERLSEEQLDMLLLNEGKITISEGGFGVLIAGAVENRGIITAPAGKIVLAGADAVKLDIDSKGLISIAIEEGAASTILDWQGKPITEQIKNAGILEANGGRVILKAESITDVFKKAINLEGVVCATRVEVEEKDGMIRLVTDGDIVINAEVKATHILIGAEEELVPKNVLIEGGYLEAEKSIQVLSNIDIETHADIISGGDIRLFADHNRDGIGEFRQLAGKIEAKGEGNIYIDASGEMVLKDVKTENGAILIGTNLAPVVIRSEESLAHIEGNYLKASAQEFHFHSEALTTHLLKSEGDFTISEIEHVDLGDLVKILGENFGVVEYLTTHNITFEAPRGDVNTAPGVIIPGNQVKISAQKIGSYDNPIGIDADITYINRLQGIIDVSEMWGCGTSICIRGPAPHPDSWGAVQYNSDSHLVLDAESVVISGDGPIHFYGNITFSNFTCTIPGKEIYFEAGKTYTILGEFKIQGAFGELVRLFSSDESGAQWYIDPQGERDIEFAWVQDSYNLHPDIIVMENSSKNDNCFNWDPTVTWTAGDGNWGTAGNWSTGMVPQPGDDVVINSAVTVTLNVNATILTLTMGGANGDTLLNFNSGVSLTVTGAVTLNGPTRNNRVTRIDVTSGTLQAGSIVINGASRKTSEVRVSTGTVTSSGNISFNSVDALLTSTGASTINVGGAFGPGGTVVLTGSTVNYNGSGAQTIQNSYSYVNLATGGSGTKTLGGATTVTGSVTVGSGTILDPSTYTLTGSGTNTLTVNGTIKVNASTFAGSYASFETRTLNAGSTVNYSGSGNQTIDNTLSYVNLATSTSGTKTLGGATTVTGSVTVGSGTTLDPSTYTLTGSGTNTLTVNGTIKVNASTFAGSYASFETRTLNAGSTVNYSASGNQTVDNTLTYSNLTISGSGTKTLGGATTVNSNLTISAGTTLDVSVSNYALNVGGNWTNNGTLAPRNGTVNLVGTGNATISGSTSFYNLSCTAGGKTIYFTAGTTQTITNTLTLTGSAGNLITLRSTVPTTQWNINPQGTRNVNYVDVQDSNNTNAIRINPLNSVDSGNNTNWFPPVISKIVFITPVQTIIAGSVSAIMTIQTQEATGTPLNVTSNTTIDLSSTSAQGKFYSDSSGINEIASVTITTGTNSASFYYKDITADSPTLTCAENPSQGWTAATQTETISPAAVNYFTVSGSASQAAGAPNALIIRAYDTYGNLCSSGVNDYSGDKFITFSGAGSTDSYNPTVTDKDGTPIAFTNTTTITFASGVSTFGGSMVLYKAETANVAATSGAITTPAPLAVTVNPGSASYLKITGATSMTAGDSNLATITARDQYGNIATSYAGDMWLEFSGANPSPDPATDPTASDRNGNDRNFGQNTRVTFTIGEATSTLKLYNAETAHIDVSDGTIGSGGDPSHGLDVTVRPAPLDHFVWSTIPTQTAGVPFTATITAKDPYGNTTIYDVDGSFFTALESATFTTTATASPAGNLPTYDGKDMTGAGATVNDVDLTAGRFVTSDIILYNAAGGSRITITHDGITGETNVIQVDPAPLDHFVWSTIPQQTAGAPFTATITAYDPYGNMTTTDVDGSPFTASESVTFTTTATIAPDGVSFPSYAGNDMRGAGYTTNVNLSGGFFTTSNMILYNASETPTVTITHEAKTGTTNAITVISAPLDHFVWSTIPEQTAGTPFTATITAKDPYDNTTTYDVDGSPFTASESVTFTSTATASPSGHVPTYGGSDLTVPVTVDVVLTTGSFVTSNIILYNTLETPTITITHETKTGTTNAITVISAPADYYVIIGGAIMAAGTDNELTISAYDPFGNIDTNYDGPKNLIFSGLSDAPDGTSPTVEGVDFGDVTVIIFTDGVAGSGAATLVAYKAETADVHAESGTITSTGHDHTVTVTPGVIDHFTVTGIKSPQTVGTLSSPVVTAYDAYENLKTDYLGTISFSSTDPSAVLPADYTFLPADNGTHTFSSQLKLKTPGTQTVTVTDGLATGSQENIIVYATYWDNSHSDYIVFPPFEYIDLDFLDTVVALYADMIFAVSISGDFGFDLLLDRIYENIRQNKIYAEWYLPGGYRTTVTVIKGKALVAPYDDKGPEYKKAAGLTDRQQTQRTKVIRAHVRVFPYREKISEAEGKIGKQTILQEAAGRAVDWWLGR